MRADGVDVRLVIPATAPQQPEASPTPGAPLTARPPVVDHSSLPRTGAPLLALLLVAVLLLALGVLAVRAGRARRHPLS